MAKSDDVLKKVANLSHGSMPRANRIVDRPSDKLNLPFHLWTRQAVSQLIEQRSGIGYSAYRVGQHLRKWVSMAQKPGRQPFERCPQEPQNWLEIEYPMIKKRVKAEKVKIQLCNEMGVRSEALARCFLVTGQTKIVPGPRKRFGCHLISRITNAALCDLWSSSNGSNRS